jgi:hypothetical protein
MLEYSKLYMRLDLMIGQHETSQWRIKNERRINKI